MKLLNGDCLELMTGIKDDSIDLIFTDMPYHMTSMAWDTFIDLSRMWQEYKRILKPSGNVVLFSSGMFTIDLINSNRSMFKYKLIWEKNVPTGMSSAKYRPMKYYEEVCIFGKGRGTYNPILKERVGTKKECYNYNHYCGNSNHVNYEKQPKKYDPNFVQPSDVLHFKVVPNRKGKLHPTQKSLDLCKYIIETYSNKGDVILDPFMGSGTIPLACRELNRDCIGIEQDEIYFAIAKRRVLGLDR